MVSVIETSAVGTHLVLSRAAERELSGVPADLPIVVLIHGYKYSPRDPRRDPHRHILGMEDTSLGKRAVSWPRRLGIEQGVVVGFGWHGVGTIWQAQAEAASAGRALADLVRIAGRPIDVIAHSLGARVALAAVARSPERSIARAILISGAEMRSRARAALATPGGRTAEVINVCSRENDMFDALYECSVAPHRPFDRAIGAGLGSASPCCVDLQLDSRRVRDALAQLGFAIPPPDRRICHWSGYLRSGTWPLYRALVEDRLPLAVLRQALPDGLEPRWSRLFDGMIHRRDLPAAPSAPS